jgi:hypothetical protein
MGWFLCMEFGAVELAGYGQNQHVLGTRPSFYTADVSSACSWWSCACLVVMVLCMLGLGLMSFHVSCSVSVYGRHACLYQTHYEHVLSRRCLSSPAVHSIYSIVGVSYRMRAVLDSIIKKGFVGGFVGVLNDIYS